jgi:hypothetical protein
MSCGLLVPMGVRVGVSVATALGGADGDGDACQSHGEEYPAQDVVQSEQLHRGECRDDHERDSPRSGHAHEMRPTTAHV